MGTTNSALDTTVTWLASAANSAPTHIAAGTDNTAYAKDDTTLGTEIVREAIETTSINGRRVTFIVVLDVGTANGYTLAEMGLFNDPTAGNMFTRTNHGAIDKTAAIELQYEITIEVTN